VSEYVVLEVTESVYCCWRMWQFCICHLAIKNVEDVSPWVASFSKEQTSDLHFPSNSTMTLKKACWRIGTPNVIAISIYLRMTEIYLKIRVNDIPQKIICWRKKIKWSLIQFILINVGKHRSFEQSVRKNQFLDSLYN
jgi:hypothetical protein